MSRLTRNLISAFLILSGLGLGGLAMWVGINLTAGPGTIVIGQEEAEGPQFADPSTLDIVTKFDRLRVCPAITQRWVWRWTTYQGRRLQQAIPLVGTYTPFLADSDEVMLTLPNPGVPDLHDKWYYRVVTTERCGFLPNWASVALGTRVIRSPDRPVNFVGDPHEK